jgi:CBS domain-containing protein
MAMRLGSIAELINDRDVITANPLLTAREAARLMARKRVGAVVVVEDGRVVGMFTERDLMNRVVAADRDPDTTTLGEVMTPDPQAVTPDVEVETVIAWMLSGRFRHLPVLEGPHLAGIVSQGDVVAFLQGRLRLSEEEPAGTPP